MLEQPVNNKGCSSIQFPLRESYQDYKKFYLLSFFRARKFHFLKHENSFFGVDFFIFLSLDSKNGPGSCIIYYSFSAMKSLQQAIIKSLHVQFFFLVERMFLFVLFFFIQDTFFTNRATTFNKNETDGIVFRRSIYLFILPTNTINQISTYMYY